MDWNALIEFDQQLLLSLNGSHSLWLDGLVMTLTTATTWIPLYVALVIMVAKNNDTFAKVLLIVACAGLCVFLAGSLDDMFVKPAVARWRPARNPELGPLVDVVNGYRGGRFGFFSAHASNTMSIAVFISLLVRHRVLTIALVAWSLLNSWTRMYLGVHYPGDILCGLLWGTLVGYGVWRLYWYLFRRMGGKTSYVSSQFTSTGYHLSDVDMVLTVLVFTLVYAVFAATLFLYV